MIRRKLSTPGILAVWLGPVKMLSMPGWVRKGVMGFCFFAQTLGLAFAQSGELPKEMVWITDGTSHAPVILSPDASEETKHAAGVLVEYVGKISGVRPDLLTTLPDPRPVHAVYVGMQPSLKTVFPEADLEFRQPEEILLLSDGKNVLIAGRDKMAGSEQLEYGTANAVYTFLQKQLGVRWLWPGPLGEDVPTRRTLAIPILNFRYAPQFRVRKFYPGQPKEWFRLQRAELDSLDWNGGHAFTKWWDAYHQTHPEYFARQPDGSRDAVPDAKNVKIAVAEPKVWKQWLDNIEDILRENPAQITFSASPNDGSIMGEDVSPEARAWDHPKGEKMKLYGKGGAYEAVALSDRYVKFWNILGRGLKKRYPDRDFMVAAMAYGPYKNPPIEARLDDNIIIGYVGHFPLANDAVTAKEKAAWKGWADNASKMVFRPNLFHYSGGWLGLPTIAVRRTANDFRFLTENSCIGLQVDTLPRSWATQGLQFYVMVQLVYDPFQNVEELLTDYFARGFGLAAGEVREYFVIMEEAHEKVLERIQHSSGMAKQALEIYPQVYTPELLSRATRALDRAVVLAKEGIFSQRVDFIRNGLEFTRTQIEIITTMAKVRVSAGKDAEAVRRAIALCERRDELSAKYPYGVVYAKWYHDARKLEDYMGPPSDAFRRVAGVPLASDSSGKAKEKSTQEKTPHGGWD